MINDSLERIRGRVQDAHVSIPSHLPSPRRSQATHSSSAAGSAPRWARTLLFVVAQCLISDQTGLEVAKFSRVTANS